MTSSRPLSPPAAPAASPPPSLPVQPPSKAIQSPTPSSSPARLPSRTLHSISTLLDHATTSLTSTSTLDTTLLTLSYSLRLLTTTSHAPHYRLSALTTLLEDLRTRLRLFGLLPILSTLLRTLSHPPKQKLDKLLAGAQVLSLLVFQASENVAYLASRNIFAMKTERVGKMWIHSARAWAFWTALELLRLERERRNHISPFHAPEDGTRSTEKQGAKDVLANTAHEAAAAEIETLITRDGETAEEFQARTARLAIRAEDFYARTREEREWWTRWRRSLLVNAAYLPMSLHYSSLGEGVRLGERWLAGLGIVVAAVTMGAVKL